LNSADHRSILIVMS